MKEKKGKRLMRLETPYPGRPEGEHLGELVLLRAILYPPVGKMKAKGATTDNES